MTFSLVFKTLFEVVLVAVALWALFNEDKFISFEERLISNIRRRRLRVKNIQKASVNNTIVLLNSNR